MLAIQIKLYTCNHMINFKLIINLIAVDSCMVILQWISPCTDWIMYWIGSSWYFVVDSCTVIWQWIGPCTDQIMYWIGSSQYFVVDSCMVILQWISPCTDWIIIPSHDNRICKTLDQIPTQLLRNQISPMSLRNMS